MPIPMNACVVNRAGVSLQGALMPQTNLPPGIPDNLKDFIRCTSNDVFLEAGDLTWLPKPDAGPIPIPDATPGLTFETGSTPGSVKISVGWGFFSISITGTIVDGKLQVEAPPIPGLGSQITEWVDNLNADLESNEMQFDGMSIENGKLHFSKKPITVTTEEETVTAPVETSLTAVTSPTPTPVTTPATTPVPVPRPDPRRAPSWTTGRESCCRSGSAGAWRCSVLSLCRRWPTCRSADTVSRQRRFAAGIKQRRFLF